MGREQMRNLETFKVGANDVNEFEYQQNQGELTEQLEHHADQQNQDAAPMTEAERVEQIMADAHEKVEERKRRGTSSYRKRPAAKQQAAKKTTKKAAAKKSIRKSTSRKATKKSGKKNSAAKKSGTKKRTTKKSGTKKSAARRSAAGKKSAAKTSRKTTARKR
jgi:hypothetical protein